MLPRLVLAVYWPCRVQFVLIDDDCGLGGYDNGFSLTQETSVAVVRSEKKEVGRSHPLFASCTDTRDKLVLDPS